MEDLKTKSVEQFLEFLKEQGFKDNVCAAFKENEIDGKSFLLLSDENFKELVKPIGPRCSLIQLKKDLLPVAIDPKPERKPEAVVGKLDEEKPKQKPDQNEPDDDEPSEPIKPKDADAMMMKWINKIDTVQQAKAKAQAQAKAKAPQGVAFIIGMYDAAGANVDVQGMERVFEKDLNFAVIRETNPTPFELKTLIDAAARVEYGLHCKYIVFYYAGHGGTDDQGKSFVCPMSDDKEYVYIEADIIRKLEVLKKKCLLFFFDCCMNINTVEGQQRQQEMKTLHNNSFVAYATSFGYVSQGDTKFGGTWTKKLCKKLTEDKEFVNIMQEVAIAVKNDHPGQLSQRHNNLSQSVNLKGTAKTGGVDLFEQPPSFDHMEEVLMNYSAQYDSIGRILKLNYDDRQKIETDNIRFLGPDKKLQAIIAKWKMIYPEATWRYFIDALKANQMNKLAGEIEKFLKSEMQH